MNEDEEYPDVYDVDPNLWSLGNMGDEVGILSFRPHGEASSEFGSEEAPWRASSEFGSEEAPWRASSAVDLEEAPWRASSAVGFQDEASSEYEPSSEHSEDLEVLAAQDVPQQKKWDRPFRSSYRPTLTCKHRTNKISERFKNSKFNQMIMIFAHGGIIDDGTQEVVSHPFFHTRHPIIHCVRYGATMHAQNMIGTMEEFVNCTTNPAYRRVPGQLELSKVNELSGDEVIDGLNCALTNKNKCFRQYDVGNLVPNLEIFTPGQHLGDEEHGMLLFDVKKKKYRDMLKNKKDMTKMGLENVKCDLEPIYGRMRGTPDQQYTNKNPQVKKTDDDGQLSIADLFGETGCLQALYSEDEAAQIPIVLFSCRASDLLSRVPWGAVAQNLDSSDMPAEQFIKVGSESSSSSSSRDSSSGQSVDTPVPNDYVTTTDVTTDVTTDSDFNISDGGKNRKKSNKKRRNRRNATKKRRNRRNATKKRRKRPNATKKRRR